MRDQDVASEDTSPPMLTDGRWPSDVYSSPVGAPLVPRFPIEYRNVEILTVCYRTDIQAIREHVPAPLKVISEVAMIHIYDMPDVQGMGHVHAANVMFGVDYDGRVGGYSTHLFIDSDVGLAVGREIHGQPKKLASPRLEVRGDLLVGVIRRNDIDIVTATIPYKPQHSSLAALDDIFDFRTNINLKVISDIGGGALIRQLTARRLSDVEAREVWGGLAPSNSAPTPRRPSTGFRSWSRCWPCIGSQTSSLSPGRCCTTIYAAARPPHGPHPLGTSRTIGTSTPGGAATAQIRLRVGEPRQEGSR